jgi:hypothetical protein
MGIACSPSAAAAAGTNSYNIPEEKHKTPEYSWTE